MSLGMWGVLESSQPEQFHHAHASPLTQKLYLAAARAISSTMLIELGITCLINATLELPTITYHLRDCLQIAVEDRVGSRLGVYFDLVADKIHAVHESQQDKIVIYCRAGMSRSASLCIAYFIKYHSMSFDEAFRYVKRRRPIIHPNVGFVRQLRDYEHRLRGRQARRVVDQAGFELSFGAECIVVDDSDLKHGLQPLRKRANVTSFKARLTKVLRIKEQLRHLPVTSEQQVLDAEVRGLVPQKAVEARCAFVSVFVVESCLQVEQPCILCCEQKWDSERENRKFTHNSCTSSNNHESRNNESGYSRAVMKRHVVMSRPQLLAVTSTITTWTADMGFETQRFALNQLMPSNQNQSKSPRTSPRSSARGSTRGSARSSPALKRVSSIRIPGLRLAAKVEKRSKKMTIHTDDLAEALHVSEPLKLFDVVDIHIDSHDYRPHHLDAVTMEEHVLDLATNTANTVIMEDVEMLRNNLDFTLAKAIISRIKEDTNKGLVVSKAPLIKVEWDVAEAKAPDPFDLCYASVRYAMSSMRIDTCDNLENDYDQDLIYVKPNYELIATNEVVEHCAMTPLEWLCLVPKSSRLVPEYDVRSLLNMECSGLMSAAETSCIRTTEYISPMSWPEMRATLTTHQSALETAQTMLASSTLDEEVLDIPEVRDGDIGRLKSMILRQNDVNQVSIWLNIFERQVLSSRPPLKPFTIITQLLFTASICDECVFGLINDLDLEYAEPRCAEISVEEPKAALGTCVLEEIIELEHIFVFNTSNNSKPMKFFPRITTHNLEKHYLPQILTIETVESLDSDQSDEIGRAELIENSDNECKLKADINEAVSTFWYFDISSAEDIEDGHVQVFMPDPPSSTSPRLRRRATFRANFGAESADFRAENSRSRSLARSSQTCLDTNVSGNAAAAENARLRTILDYAQHCLWSRSTRIANRRRKT